MNRFLLLATVLVTFAGVSAFPAFAAEADPVMSKSTDFVGDCMAQVNKTKADSLKAGSPRSRSKVTFTPAERKAIQNCVGAASAKDGAMKRDHMEKKGSKMYKKRQKDRVAPQ